MPLVNYVHKKFYDSDQGILTKREVSLHDVIASNCTIDLLLCVKNNRNSWQDVNYKTHDRKKSLNIVKFNGDS
jgi:hypothetical protein